MDKLLLTTSEAADALGIGHRRVFYLLQHGEIESVQIGRSRRIPREAITEYVTRLRAGQDDAA